MEIDVPYSLRLLEKINALTIEGKPVYEHFHDGQYSGWSLQQFFLLSQIKEFSKTKDYIVYKKARTPRYFLLSRIAMVVNSGVVFIATSIGYLFGLCYRPKAALFCSDFLKPDSPINPRLFVVMKHLQEKHIAYMEILHVTTMRNFYTNMVRRRRPAVYMESLQVISTGLCLLKGVQRYAKNHTEKISFDAFSPTERVFVEALTREAIINICRNRITTNLLRHVMQTWRVHHFVSIDDARYTSEILRACEKAQIPSHIFQHSNFDYLVGLDTLPPQSYVFPSTFVSWNSYWVRRITLISPLFLYYKNRMTIGGRPYAFTPPKQVAHKEPKSGENITVLMPYEVALEKRQVGPFLDVLLNDERVHILFLLRGDFDRNLQVTRYFGDAHFTHPRLAFVEPKDKAKAINETDVVLGAYSGFLDEVVEMGLPVCILETDYININRLDRDNLAILVDVKKHDIFEKLKEAQSTPGDVLEERKIRISSGAGSAEEYIDRIFTIS